jgi:hypothetical protein
MLHFSANERRRAKARSDGSTKAGADPTSKPASAHDKSARSQRSGISPERHTKNHEEILEAQHGSFLRGNSVPGRFSAEIIAHFMNDPGVLFSDIPMMSRRSMNACANLCNS